MKHRTNQVLAAVLLCFSVGVLCSGQPRRKTRPIPRKVAKPPVADPATQGTKPAAAKLPMDALTGEWDLYRKVLGKIDNFKMRLQLSNDRVTGSIESSGNAKPIVRGSWHSGKLDLAYGDPNDPAEMTGYFRNDELWGRIVLPEKEKIYLDRLPGVWRARRIEPVTPKTTEDGKYAPAASQIKKVGIVFQALVARIEGTEKLIAEKLRKGLEEKTSESTEKVPVAILKTLEQATAEDIDIVFAIEYREEIGAVSRSAMQGNLTNIYCKFSRLDQNKISTTWDKLNLRDTGEVVEWLLEYSNMGIGGALADLSLYATCYSTFRSLIPVLKIESGRTARSFRFLHLPDEAFTGKRANQFTHF